MPHLSVKSTADTTASADQTWAVVRDFCAPWHPLIDRMQAEAGQAARVRRFSVKGEDTIYRERLTYFSATQRRMSYTHLSGIAGVQRYDAHLSVIQTDKGARIKMAADLTAPAPRADEIAAGTQAIFDMGTQEIAKLAVGHATEGEASITPTTAPLQDMMLNTSPRLALTTGGARTDTLCLFLHGIGGNRSNWNAQLAALAAHVSVAALDLRGYGDSLLGGTQSTIEDYCNDILAVMAHLRASKLILCGLSYGAWIATSFAMRYPEKLNALVLSGGCTGMSEASAEVRTAFRESRQAPLRAGQTPADFAPAVIKAIAGPNAPPAAHRALLDSTGGIPATTYADALHCFTHPPEVFDFARLTMPTLLMTGAYDVLAPPSEIASVADRIWRASPRRDVRFEVISGAGHVCNLEAPRRYTAILRDFLKRVVP